MKYLMLCLFLISSTTHAGVYKCHGTDGNIKYQKNPCVVDGNDQPLDLKQPSAAVMQRMQTEAFKRNYYAAQTRLKEIELEQKAYKLQLEAERINALNRSINAGIQMHEDHMQESADRNAAWSNYYSCRDRQQSGHISPRNRCIRP